MQDMIFFDPSMHGIRNADDAEATGENKTLHKHMKARKAPVFYTFSYDVSHGGSCGQ
jgi:hypothetical protein